MIQPQQVRIIGGGLAGLTLGIGLRQRGIPVRIYEAGTYPRHRVCGEFISGRGQDVLVRLGLQERLMDAGARRAETARFFLGKAQSPERLLTPPAFCVSRFALDAMLARRFRELGGDLREKERGDPGGEGVVQATGRRLQSGNGRWHWFGLKVHASNITLSADLEMHGLNNGYVGMCRLAHGEVNVCGLFRRRSGNEATVGSWREILRGAKGTALYDRFSGAALDENSFCAVAGLSLDPQHAADSELRVGDALTMIPPVTGNGMSMAFEAAEAAVEPLAAYSRGEIDWRSACQIAARSCDSIFATRLAWARFVQWLMFAPFLRGNLGEVVLSSAGLWRLLFVRTRFAKA